MAAAALVSVVGIAAGIIAARDDHNARDIDVIDPGPEATTSLVPSTSVAPPSTSPVPTAPTPPPDASDVRSVVISPNGVLGSWNGSGWVPTSDGIPLQGGETVTVFRMGQPSATAIGSAPRPECAIYVDPMHHIVDYGVDEPLDRTTPHPIGVVGVAAPQPRPVTVLPTDGAVYRDAAREMLKRLGVDDPNPTLVQVLRADVDGDGTDDVFVVAERISDPDRGLFAAPGNYSIIFQRRLVDEQVVTTPIWESIARDHPGETPFVEFARISNLVDLNGDAVMEIVVQTMHYEGASSLVYETEPAAVTKVLATGCGV